MPRSWNLIELQSSKLMLLCSKVKGMIISQSGNHGKMLRPRLGLVKQLVIAMLRPGQTLALAGPEARHYNHPGTAPAPRPRSKCLY